MSDANRYWIRVHKGKYRSRCGRYTIVDMGEGSTPWLATGKKSLQRYEGASLKQAKEMVEWWQKEEAEEYNREAAKRYEETTKQREQQVPDKQAIELPLSHNEAWAVWRLLGEMAESDRVTPEDRPPLCWVHERLFKLLDPNFAGAPLRHPRLKIQGVDE